jgi:hypothetical protein
MHSIKKTLWVGLTGVAGLLLTLAGFNLIALSPELIKYTGIALLVFSALFYILPDGRSNVTITKASDIEAEKGV